MPKSVPILDIAPHPADDRRMRNPGRTTSAGRRRTSPVRAVVACLLLALPAGCSSGAGSPTPGRNGSSSGTPSSVGAFPEEPHATGRLPLTVRAALIEVGRGTCVPGERRLCSRDDSQGWAPIGEPGRATLLEALARPADGHTTWTVLMRFSRGSRDDLHEAADTAGASGGVLALVADGRVVAAVPPTGLHGSTAALEDLDQPAAWGLVEALGGR